ncbi:Ig-specific serine endopeptidase MIP [Mycoplasmopsis primatum]|uniref:Ig-specific serine endopeptidase MIP n=1 Tax=Mycoplasmopsis primatum TaxID=55604 RepID=UPI0004953A37|nr:DUF31 family protein [Mycoplasmopsis primatum]
MKHKKIMFSLLAINLGFIPMIVACKNTDQKEKDPNNNSNNKNPDNNSNNNEANPPINKDLDDINNASDEFKKIVNEIKFPKTFDFKMKDHMLTNLNYDQLLPTQVKNNLDKGIEITLNEFKNEIEISVLDAIITKDSNVNGKFQLSLKITDKKTGKNYNHILDLSGFKTSPFGADEYGKIPSSSADSLKPSDPRSYINASQENRFLTDNTKYMHILKQQKIQQELNKVRPDLNTNDKAIQEFNQKAKALNQDIYENAARKGFTVPTYDQNGQFLGLSIAKEEMGKGPSWVDGLGRDINRINGLARTLPNENYLRAAKQTFGVTISTEKNPEKREYITTSGTMWLMDYQKRSDNKYPTKWYFGTNMHVADALKNNSTSFSILKLMDTAKIKSTFKLTNLDPNFRSFLFSPKDSNNNKYITNNGIKTIFSASNFLSSKPADFLNDKQKNEYANVEEFLDFSVFEIDFEKIEFNGLTGAGAVSADYENLDAHDLAKLITNNYANDDSAKIKFKSTSYLTDYSKIDFPLAKPKNDPEWYKKKDELFAVGYPNSTGDYFLRQYVDDDQIKYRNQFNFSLWTNSDYRFYNELTGDTFEKERTDRGNYLSYALGYRSFTNKPGVLDSFISAPFAGNKFYESNGNQYISMGLEYLIRHYAPVGGASGTSIRTQNNEIIGVYHISNASAHTGLAVAFRSEGFDYQNLYGSYNLPQYDLIYGGGKNQINSYRQALLNAYQGQDIKTSLFENGLNNIPSEFQFH